jgi:hypothetical protein
VAFDQVLTGMSQEPIYYPGGKQRPPGKQAFSGENPGLLAILSGSGDGFEGHWISISSVRAASNEGPSASGLNDPGNALAIGPILRFLSRQ